jgi:hypothetical protein
LSVLDFSVLSIDLNEPEFINFFFFRIKLI